MIAWLAQTARIFNGTALVIYIIQAIFAPILMFICGFILVFKGWRRANSSVYANFII